MTLHDPRPVGLVLPLFLAASTVTAITAVIVAIRRAPPRREPAPEPAAVAMLVAPAEPILSEAQVYRPGAGVMAIASDARRERQAHPRTLETMRYLRAFPGAPPRIPHELTPDEFRTGTCNTCHERGGYSRRFEAYVPVTPHPDNGPCLQCHLGADEVMAVPLTSPDANRRCHQCHGTGGTPGANIDRTPEWRTTAWPPVPAKSSDGTPPPIPHDLQGRGNCLACHAGPAAVAETRTTHPEWTDCRQCHVAPNPEVGLFTRAASAGGRGTGGPP